MPSVFATDRANVLASTGVCAAGHVRNRDSLPLANRNGLRQVGNHPAASEWAPNVSIHIYMRRYALIKQQMDEPYR